LKGDDIAERLIQFSVDIIKYVDTMPGSYATRHICSQMVRSGTSAGANYEEARGAESGKDFIHKLGICLKELRETRYWLKILGRAGYSLQNHEQILQEADELCRIIGKSVLTSKQKGNA